MTYQDFVASILYTISTEIIKYQRVSGPDLFDTPYQRAQEIFDLAYHSACPRSFLYEYGPSYHLRFSTELPLLWPAFLHELQQSL